MEKPIDQTIRRLRPAIFAVAAMAFPVFLLSYGYAIKLLYQNMSAWMFVLVAVSHVTVWIGMSCLADHQRERQT